MLEVVLLAAEEPVLPLLQVAWRTSMGEAEVSNAVARKVTERMVKRILCCLAHVDGEGKTECNEDRLRNETKV